MSSFSPESVRKCCSEDSTITDHKVSLADSLQNMALMLELSNFVHLNAYCHYIDSVCSQLGSQVDIGHETSLATSGDKANDEHEESLGLVVAGSKLCQALTRLCLRNSDQGTRVKDCPDTHARHLQVNHVFWTESPRTMISLWS